MQIFTNEEFADLIDLAKVTMRGHRHSWVVQEQFEYHLQEVMCRFLRSVHLKNDVRGYPGLLCNSVDFYLKGLATEKWKIDNEIKTSTKQPKKPLIPFDDAIRKEVEKSQSDWKPPPEDIIALKRSFELVFGQDLDLVVQNKVEGISVRELAERFGCKEHQMKSKIAKTLKKMAKSFDVSQAEDGEL